jgi:phage tail-like protein
MNASQQHRYRFANAGQWATGLSTRVDADALDATGAIAPQGAYQDTAQRFPSAGAFGPAAARDGRVFWRADGCALLRLDPEDEAPHAMPAPCAPNAVRRMAAGQDNLWLAGGTPPELRCHDIESLARRFIIAPAGARLIDFAADGRDGVWALAWLDADGSRACCIHLDCAGYEVGRLALAGPAAPVQLTWLAREQRLIVMAAGGKQLHCYTPDDPQQLFTVDVDRVRPCFGATCLGSDGRSRIVLAGVEHAAWGGGATVLTLDADGVALHALPLRAPATGIHATRDSLLVTTADGLLRFALDGASGGAAEASCTFITPVLQSPLNDNPRRWLRAEALALLPPGASMEISYAATADPRVQEQARRIAADRSVPAAQRIALLLDRIGDWQAPIVFRGTDAGADTPLAVPLFDVHEPWLWIRVTLVAAPGAALPRLRRLDVLYPGLTLMEYLPRIYQRAEAEPGNFLRALVGVIETSTQEQDRRIAAMGSMIAPDTAPVAWLDYVARWLDLPWDDALDEQQKRRLLAQADLLAARRGTRAGLETLLEALMPGSPPRYRVIDMSAQYGFATLGAAPLPALLAGLPASALALNRKAILGQGRLTCRDAPPDDVAHLTGQVTVNVTATASERAAWEPWLAALIGDVLPASARLVLHWRSVAGRLMDDRLGDDFTLGDAPASHLGTDAVTGLSRLGAGPGARLR